MKVRAAIKKVKAHFKKQGIDIEIHSPAGYSHKWWFQHNNYVGSFSSNGFRGSDPAALDGQACLFHVRREDDHTDSMTDYFAGSYRDNITQVCESLLPALPKFSVGSLVKGKHNKRSIRWGNAGKVGLVVAHKGGKYLDIQWCGEKRSASIPERDVELAQ